MKNKIFAYIRVSTQEQNIDRQTQAIKDYCKFNNITVDSRDIFIDKASGKNFNRPQYEALKQCLREGDTLIIKELDRLGRNMNDIKKEWKYFNTEKINIIVIENSILNTNNKTDLEKSLISNIVFEILSYMAEKERVKIKQRQKEGIASAKAKGKNLGRPKINLSSLSNNQKKLLKENYINWKKKKITGIKFMQILELKKNSFYKIIKEYEMKLK